MAHTIIVDDKEYHHSIVEISDDRRSVRVIPYTEEIHSTAWVDGTLCVTNIEGRYRLLVDPL